MRKFALVLMVLASSCSSNVRRFSDQPIVWVDNDARAYSPAPTEYYSPYFWDAIDNLLFRPASEVWLLETEREAMNVNAVDEVPSSSWFVNRLGRRTMTPEEMALGACDSMTIDAPAPWTIFGGKPDGATPGFLIEDANGDRYVLKVDRPAQAEQSTAAHSIVSAMYHAAGYHVPCIRVVSFTEDMLVLDDEATVEFENSGTEQQMTQEHIDLVLESAARAPHGRYRAVLSRFIDGRPIGPATFEGTRDGDPNDVVPHEHRRELRGMYVMNAWVNHWDARDQNTLSAWIERPNGGYVRHYLIDFDESLGMLEGNDRRARRFGHSQWLDTQHIAEDALTLGFVVRPWDSGNDRPHPVLGHYEVEGFDPTAWRPDYWNGAFDRRTEHDEAWMARIIARFTREHLRALARLGNYTDPEVERELVRILAGRQQRILERWLTRLSPLTDPVIQDGQVCVTDLAVSSNLRWPQDRVYVANVYTGDPLRLADDLPIRRDGARLCVPVPNERGYVVVDVVARTVDAETNGPLRLHLMLDGRARLLGLERPRDSAI
jgi:hypothetical protein